MSDVSVLCKGKLRTRVSVRSDVTIRPPHARAPLLPALRLRLRVLAVPLPLWAGVESYSGMVLGFKDHLLTQLL